MPGYPRWLLFVGLAVLAAAQEKSALETAKSDLNALPATKAELGQTMMPAMPRLDAPTPLLKDNRSLPMPSVSALRKQGEQAKGNGSSQWLVDAMMKNNRRPATDRPEAANRQAVKYGYHAEGLWLAEAEDGMNDPASELRKVGQSDNSMTTLRAGNPLKPYMSDWISKRDFALLLPDPVPSAPDGGRGPQPGESPVGISPSGILHESGRSSAGSPDGFNPVKAKNPYLDAMSPADFSERSRSPKPDSRFAPPSAVRDPDATEPPGKTIKLSDPMDLAKPAQDAKYFPQLKRF